MRALLTIAALLFAGTGCAATEPPLTPPSRGGAPWFEVTSAHFRLRTDVGQGAAERATHDLEESHAALAFALQRPDRAGEAPLDVVMFARQRDFREMRGAGTAKAFYTAHVPGEASPKGFIVLVESDLPDETRRILQHELTHFFVHARFARTPRWLDEGLAEFYSSARRDGDRLILGGPASVDFSDRVRHWLAWVDGLPQYEVPRDQAPPLRMLVDADRPEFYGATDEEATSTLAAYRRVALYAGAWRLVDLLVAGTNLTYRAAFNAYLDALAHGADPRQAFEAGFGASMPQLESDYRAAIAEGTRPLVAVRGVPHAPTGNVATRPMESAEVELLWSRLAPARAERPELGSPLRDPRREK